MEDSASGNFGCCLCGTNTSVRCVELQVAFCFLLLSNPSIVSTTTIIPSSSLIMPPKGSKSKASASSSTAATTKPVKRGPPAPIRYYLVFFNFLSFFGWVIILSTLVKHLALGPQPHSGPVKFATDVLSRFRLVKIGIVKSYSHLFPERIAAVLERASNSHTFVGSIVALVQSLAVLEVVHAAIGWVRSPVATTAIQVASRLFMVWGVTERYSQAWSSPFYASMVLAWAITECIRYPFYANQLLGQEGPGLLWAR